jgi:hypothetical protein
LVAIGFELVLKDSTTNEIVQIESMDVNEVESLWCDAISKKTNMEHKLKEFSMELEKESNQSNLCSILSLLNPNTPFDIILELHEPLVDNLSLLPSTLNSNRDMWLDWYDALKADRDTLENFLKASR